MFDLEPLECRRLASTSKTLFYVDRTFTADASREALEIVGGRPVHFVGCTFAGGSTSCRINGVANVTFEDCVFLGALGRPDPDGSDLQCIDCSMVRVEGCVFYSSRNSEDLCSIFVDDVNIHPLVVIAGSNFYGKGKSESGNSICIDGRYDSTVYLSNLRFVHNRCGVTIANASDVTFGPVTFLRCGTQIWQHEYYA